MGIYRTYFDKNNTIISDKLINTGRNQVSELYYGDKVSRFLFYCDFSEIKKKVAEKEIIIENGVKHYLKIKNTSSFDVSQFLSESNNLVFDGNFRSSSFNLVLRLVDELWDEGMGYDFNKQPAEKNINRSYSEEPSNWYYRTQIEEFTTDGGINTLNNLAEQHFDQGNEDVLMDITDIVNTIITDSVITGETTGATSGTTLDYQGFCLKYSDDYENYQFADGRTNVLGLFTRHTQTFFEPFIETVYDDLINDDRNAFYQNKKNRLFLYVNVNNRPTNLDALPVCTITNENYVVKQKTKGVYYIEITPSSNIFDTYVQYNDIWSNIIIDGVSRSDIKLTFVPIDDNEYYMIGSETNTPIPYGISLSGVKRGEKLYQGDIRKIFVNLRKPYTVDQKDVVTDIFYRLSVRQGTNVVELLDWTEVNRANNSNFFTIDTTWLIPQNYIVDIKVDRNGEVNIYNKELHFTVVGKF